MAVRPRVAARRSVRLRRVIGITASTFGLSGWMEKAAYIAVTVGIAIVLLALIKIIVPRAERSASRSEDPAKWQQRRTAVALLATVLRYIVLVLAIIAVVIILAGLGRVGALGGGALLAIMVGFATQRLLTDVIAGFFILFEGQYAVGDAVTLQSSGLTGIVETLGIRTTLLHLADGSRASIPNGQISAVIRHRSVYTDLIITAITTDPAAVRTGIVEMTRLAEDTGEIVGRPYDEEEIEMGDGVRAVRVRVKVPTPRLDESMAFVTAALGARLGDTLLGAPVVIPVPRERDNLMGPTEKP